MGLLRAGLLGPACAAVALCPSVPSRGRDSCTHHLAQIIMHQPPAHDPRQRPARPNGLLPAGGCPRARAQMPSTTAHLPHALRAPLRGLHHAMASLHAQAENRAAEARAGRASEATSHAGGGGDDRRGGAGGDAAAPRGAVEAEQRGRVLAHVQELVSVASIIASVPSEEEDGPGSDTDDDDGDAGDGVDGKGGAGGAGRREASGWAWGWGARGGPGRAFSEPLQLLVQLGRQGGSRGERAAGGSWGWGLFC